MAMLGQLVGPSSPPPPYRLEPSIPFLMRSPPAHLKPDPPESLRIQAYARLEFAERVDFYIRKTHVIIGRRTGYPALSAEGSTSGKLLEGVVQQQPAIERSPLLRPVSDARSSPSSVEPAPMAEEEDTKPSSAEQSAGIAKGTLPDSPEGSPIHVDLDLGPIKAISRDHAHLYYDSQAGSWMLDVRGRNGVVVDGHWHSKGELVYMHHATRIQIAERVFYFMLPEMRGSSEGLTDDSETEYTSEAPSPPLTAAPQRAARRNSAPRGRGRGRASGTSRVRQTAISKTQAPSPELKRLPARANRGKGKMREDYLEDPLAMMSSSSAGAGTSSIKVKLTVPARPLRMPENEYTGKAAKPPYTMASLVAQAISHTEGGNASAAEVIRWIKAAYPFFDHDLSLAIDVDKRLRDARFFAPANGTTWGIVTDDQLPQYFDGTVFRKRAQPQAGQGSVSPAPVAVPAKTSAQPSTGAPLPIVIENLPPEYDPAAAPMVDGLTEPPIVIHEGRMILAPAVFKHLLKDPDKLDALRKMPTDKAIAALRQFVVAFLKAKAAKAEKRKAREEVPDQPSAKLAKKEV